MFDHGNRSDQQNKSPLWVSSQSELDASIWIVSTQQILTLVNATLFGPVPIQVSADADVYCIVKFSQQNSYNILYSCRSSKSMFEYEIALQDSQLWYFHLVFLTVLNLGYFVSLRVNVLLFWKDTRVVAPLCVCVRETLVVQYPIFTRSCMFVGYPVFLSSYRCDLWTSIFFINMEFSIFTRVIYTL